MSFSFSGAQPSGFAAMTTGDNAGAGQTLEGPEVKEVETEQLGFQSLARNTKLRLLPSPWPSQNLPPPSSSLLSVASRQGLIAAGGPESVVIASTESIRQAFSAEDAGEKSHLFSPQVAINVGTRVSQVAFTADEKYLAISAEVGGGLAVYDVESLLQGTVKSAFEIATNGEALRAMVPNPAKESAELVAIVTTNGKLMIANLNGRQIASGSQGPILKENVSCLSWSNKGKQLVAGQLDGTCSQMTPAGDIKAQVPRPPHLEHGKHGMMISPDVLELLLIGIL